MKNTDTSIFGIIFENACIRAADAFMRFAKEAEKAMPRRRTLFYSKHSKRRVYAHGWKIKWPEK